MLQVYTGKAVLNFCMSLSLTRIYIAIRHRTKILQIVKERVYSVNKAQGAVLTIKLKSTTILLLHYQAFRRESFKSIRLKPLYQLRLPLSTLILVF